MQLTSTSDITNNHAVQPTLIHQKLHIIQVHINANLKRTLQLQYKLITYHKVFLYVVLLNTTKDQKPHLVIAIPTVC